MTTLARAREDLADTLTAALTDADNRVASTPLKPGSMSRYEALVTVGAISLSPDVAELMCELDIQIGIGTSIGDAYDAMDEVLDAVNTAIPVNWELAQWNVEVDQDDQTVLFATTVLNGHRAEAAAQGDNLLIVAGSSLLINATDALDIN